MTKCKLGDICEIVSGSTPKTSIAEYWDGDVKWITPAELSDDTYIIMDSVRKITKLAVEKTGLRSIPKGTVILSSRAPIGKVAIAGCELYCNQGFKNLICSDVINNKYLYWFLRGNTIFLNSLGRGATFKEISKSIVSEIEINIPSIMQQKKVVENLEKLNRIISIRKQELQLLDELVRGRFVELFGDIISNEKGWETDIWSNVLKIVNGKNQKAVESEDGEYLICGSGGAMGRATEYLTNENSVIIGRKGSINKPLLMREKYWNVDTAFGIEPNTKYINVDYLYMFCVFFNFEKLNKAVTIPSLTKTDLLNIEMPIPNILLQNQFADFVHQIDKSKFGHLSMLTTMKSAYDQQTFIYP